MDWEDLLRGLGQGASLSWGDELAGAVGSLEEDPYEGERASERGVDGDMDDRSGYEVARDQIRNQNQLSEERSPGMYTAGQVIGSIPAGVVLGSAAAGAIPAAAASMPGAALGAAAGGGLASGTIRGAGAAEGGPLDTAIGAMQGGQAESQFGAAVTGAGGLLAKPIRSLMNRANINRMEQAAIPAERIPTDPAVLQREADVLRNGGAARNNLFGGDFARGHAAAAAADDVSRQAAAAQPEVPPFSAQQQAQLSQAQRVASQPTPRAISEIEMLDNPIGQLPAQAGPDGVPQTQSPAPLARSAPQPPQAPRLGPGNGPPGTEPLVTPPPQPTYAQDVMDVGAPPPRSPADSWLDELAAERNMSQFEQADLQRVGQEIRRSPVDFGREPTLAEQVRQSVGEADTMSFADDMTRPAPAPPDSGATRAMPVGPRGPGRGLGAGNEPTSQAAIDQNYADTQAVFDARYGNPSRLPPEPSGLALDQPIQGESMPPRPARPGSTEWEGEVVSSPEPQAQAPAPPPAPARQPSRIPQAYRDLVQNSQRTVEELTPLQQANARGQQASAAAQPAFEQAMSDRDLLRMSSENLLRRATGAGSAPAPAETPSIGLAGAGMQAARSAVRSSPGLRASAQETLANAPVAAGRGLSRLRLATDPERNEAPSPQIGQKPVKPVSEYDTLLNELAGGDSGDTYESLLEELENM